MTRSRPTTGDGLDELADQTSTTTGSLLPQEPARRLLRRALELLGACELGEQMIEVLATDEPGLRVAVQGVQAVVIDVGERKAAANAPPGTDAGMSRH